MENETNESLWRLNTLFGFDEMIERGQTFCEAIGAVPGSNPLNVHNSIFMTRVSQEQDYDGSCLQVVDIPDEEEEPDMGCEICRQGDREHLLLLCDSCDLGIVLK